MDWTAHTHTHTQTHTHTHTITQPTCACFCVCAFYCTYKRTNTPLPRTTRILHASTHLPHKHNVHRSSHNHKKLTNAICTRNKHNVHKKHTNTKNTKDTRNTKTRETHKHNVCTGHQKWADARCVRALWPSPGVWGGMVVGVGVGVGVGVAAGIGVVWLRV